MLENIQPKVERKNRFTVIDTWKSSMFWVDPHKAYDSTSLINFEHYSVMYLSIHMFVDSRYCFFDPDSWTNRAEETKISNFLTSFGRFLQIKLCFSPHESSRFQLCSKA